jgi:hypothetical protein
MIMADQVTRQELAQAFDDAINAQVNVASGESLVAASLPDDAKALFCKDWGTIKLLLQFIGSSLGGIPGLAVKGLIAAGDLLHGRIC